MKIFAIHPYHSKTKIDYNTNTDLFLKKIGRKVKGRERRMEEKKCIYQTTKKKLQVYRVHELLGMSFRANAESGSNI